MGVIESQLIFGHFTTITESANVLAISHFLKY